MEENKATYKNQVHQVIIIAPTQYFHNNSLPPVLHKYDTNPPGQIMKNKNNTISYKDKLIKGTDLLNKKTTIDTVNHNSKITNSLHNTIAVNNDTSFAIICRALKI